MVSAPMADLGRLRAPLFFEPGRPLALAARSDAAQNGPQGRHAEQGCQIPCDPTCCAVFPAQPGDLIILCTTDTRCCIIWLWTSPVRRRL